MVHTGQQGKCRSQSRLQHQALEGIFSHSLPLPPLSELRNDIFVNIKESPLISISLYHSREQSSDGNSSDDSQAWSSATSAAEDLRTTLVNDLTAQSGSPHWQVVLGNQIGREEQACNVSPTGGSRRIRNSRSALTTRDPVSKTQKQKPKRKRDYSEETGNGSQWE